MRKSTNTSYKQCCYIIRLAIWLGLFFICNMQTNAADDRLYIWNDMMHKNHIYIAAYTGLGTYSMNDMRAIQDNILATYGVNAIANSDFPPYWLYGLNISQRYDLSRFGLNFEIMSTGARASLADYSGEFISDFVCKGYKLGCYFEKDIITPKLDKAFHNLGYRLEAGGISSVADNTVNIILKDETEEVTSKALMRISCISNFIEPSVYYKWHLDKKSSIQFSLGYMLDFQLSNVFRQDIPVIGWAGIRLKLGLVKQL